MTGWILVWTLIIGHGGSVGTAWFPTERACLLAQVELTRMAHDNPHPYRHFSIPLQSKCVPEAKR